MSLTSFQRPSSVGRTPGLLLASAALVMLSSLACNQGGTTPDATQDAAQDVMTDVAAQDAAAANLASFMADLEAMEEKFIGLAEAFPEDTYTWRPMDGVRSVSEVLMLIAREGYGFAPTALGGTAAMSREEMGELNAITD